MIILLSLYNGTLLGAVLPSVKKIEHSSTGIIPALVIASFASFIFPIIYCRNPQERILAQVSSLINIIF